MFSDVAKGLFADIFAGSDAANGFFEAESFEISFLNGFGFAAGSRSEEPKGFVEVCDAPKGFVDACDVPNGFVEEEVCVEPNGFVEV